MGFLGSSMVKNPHGNAEDKASIPGLGRYLGEWSGNPLQYSCLGNLIDRGAWQAIVLGVTKSWSQLATKQQQLEYQASLVAQWQKNLPAKEGNEGSTRGLKKIPWRRKWQMTPVYLPGKSHGQSSLAGYNPWGHRTAGHNSATCSVAQLCPTLCNPMNCSTPGLPVPHHLPKLAQAHIHCISDAIQSSHPLTPPSLSTLNLSQNQGLFQWVNCSHQMNKILELQLQHQSFQWIFRTDFLQDWLVWSPCYPRDSQYFSSTTVWRHQFFGTPPSLRHSSHNGTWPLGRL